MESWLPLPRCFVDEPGLQPGRVLLDKAEGRHLSRVRRIGGAGEVAVLNGRGQVGRGILSVENREEVWVDIRELRYIPPSSPVITLLIGALKQSAWDEMLKHAVELGVNRIIRVQSVHAVADLKSEKEIRKRQRWQECMREACKQSANPWLPQLDLAGSVADAVDQVDPQAFQLLASLQENARPLRLQLPGEAPKELAVWIGPEGDFSEGEVQQISQGAVAVSLGPRILRAETAVLAVLSHLRLALETV